MTNSSIPPELDELNREDARRRLLAFTQYTKPDYCVNWHHKILAEKLDRVAASQCRRLMIFMPPQHGKSELVSRRFPAFLLGRNPDLRLIACSHTNDLAVAMNRDVQRIIIGKRFKNLFSEVTLDRSSCGSGMLGRMRNGHFVRKGDRGEIIARRTMGLFEIPGHRGSLRSAGVGNSIVGNPADGLIIDDPFGKREDAESPLARERIWQWFNSDLYTRQSKNGWIVLTHTRWHRDDLAGRLLKKMADRLGDQWEVLCLPAVREEGPADLCDQRTQPGEVLWPGFKSAADLEIIRRQDPRTYAALYQQNPADAAGAEWPSELFGDWIWVPPERWPKQFDLRVVCVDASKGRSDKQGDYCAIVFVGMGEDRLVYVDAIIERIPLDQIVRKTIVFCDEKQPQYVGIESEQFQELLVHEFRRQRAQAGGMKWPLYGMKTHGIPKVMRIRGLSQFICPRQVRFKADSPGCRLLVDQLMDFPLADHDDGPDALEMCTRLPLEQRRSREIVSCFPDSGYYRVNGM